MRSTWRASVAAAFVLAAFSARSARADENARAVYDEAAAAYNAHDYARAATLFARADALKPDATVLRLALAAAIQADDAVLGENLVLRAYGRGSTPELIVIEDEARRHFESRVVRVRVVCASDDSNCAVRVRDQEMHAGEERAFEPGEIDAVFASRASTIHLGGSPGTRVDVVEAANVIIAPTHDAVIAERAPRGISPAWFVVGTLITAALGGATIASGYDTSQRYDAFRAQPSTDTQSAGESAQLRTNVLLTTTLVMAVTTAIVGVFATRWSRSHGFGRSR